MKVEVVAFTKPVNAELTAEDFLAYAARVSNPSNQNNTETAPKLLKFLMRNQHWSPFEMVSVTMQIDTTRDIARQILRHRSFSFQEFSQRYADASQLGFETREARLQDTKNRQNSTELDKSDEYQGGLSDRWLEMQERLLEDVKSIYKWALDNGIAKEQARAVLPEGMTHSRLYMAGTLRSWVHYCQLRCGHGTQKEHMEIAKAAREELKKLFPSLEIHEVQKE